ncbi:hypothetical protein [Haloterrigena alkaliphila]|uniref:Uncharacterized protein n=1 Tax=Haloterrigena alkaliphila TaxID=2816475 RepID=A0A8A2VCN6_9EURY|nr:hypothetical protein [Haloterrigena alkaliphila]QSW98214.1 hypothetical protein J0X25_12455 [Haloterrigena alkaliphila]
MRTGPLYRSLGIAALTAGLLGLLALGGAGWSLEAGLTDGSSDTDEIAVFEGVDLDLGADYRDVGSAAADTGATDRSVTAGVASVSTAIASDLVAPADRSEQSRIGGLLYVHIVSLLGAALVAVRALVGWRVDVRRLSLEPTGRLSFGGSSGSEPTRRQRSRTRRVPRGGE